MSEVPDWMRKNFEEGYVPMDEPPGLEERAYRNWIMETDPPRPHPDRMATDGLCVLCKMEEMAMPHCKYAAFGKEANRKAAEPAAEWAIVELLGHRRLAGRLSEVERFGCKMARLDVPQEDGSFVTQFFGGQSVYSLTIVTEAVARDRVKRERIEAAPVQPWDYPKQLVAPVENRPTHDDDDDDDSDLDPDDSDLPRW